MLPSLGGFWGGESRDQTTSWNRKKKQNKQKRQQIHSIKIMNVCSWNGRILLRRQPDYDIMGYFTAFKLSLSKSKLITTKTPHKKSYARMIQWKGPSVLCRTRGWRSSNYTSFALRFHKTLKSAEVSKVFLLLYFFVIRFQLIIAGGILIFASWCCRFTPGWRYTVTSLNDKYQSVVKGHSHNMSNTHDRVWPSTSFPVPFPSKGKGPGNEVGLTTLPNTEKKVENTTQAEYFRRTSRCLEIWSNTV